MEKYPNENNYNPNPNNDNNGVDYNSEKINSEENFKTVESNENVTSNIYGTDNVNNTYNPYSNDDYKTVDASKAETQNIEINSANSYGDNFNSYSSANENSNEGFSSTNFLNDKDYSSANYETSPYQSTDSYNNSQQADYQQTQHNQQYQYTPPQKPKKPKKTISVGVLAVVLVIGILVSGAIGTVGGVLATSALNEYNNNSTETDPTHTTTVNQSTPTGPGMTTEEIVAATADTVVEITTEVVQTGSFNQQYIESGAGSGVIISDDGYIVTNNHVIEGATKINVTLRDGTSYEAQLVGTAEPTLDIALLKIDGKNLKYASMGDSDSLQVGQEIVVIGNPLGQLGGSVTDGIISALNRDLVIDGTSMNVLQTNAAINPGNSGGGMFNDQGELVGIIVAKSTGDEVEGLGFAIPINQVKNVIDDLKESGYVRGNIQVGMSLVDITNEQMAMMYRVDALGVYVQSVELNSAAFDAGLQSGDRITAIDGTEVSTAQEVKDIFNQHEVGDVVKVSIARGSETGDLDLTLTESIPEDIQNETTTDRYTQQQEEAENAFEGIFG